MLLRILTYNIHHAEGNDGKLDPGRITAVIRESGADLVGLNEVFHPFLLAEGREPMLTEMARDLEMRYVFGTTLPDQPGSSFQAPYGNALLSRYPILNAATYRLPAPEGRESRGVVAADVVLEHGRALTCYVTHLDHRSEQVRLEQCEHITQVTTRFVGESHILIGDFNALAPGDYQDRQEELAELEAGSKGAHMATMQVVPRLLRAGYIDAQAAVGKIPAATWSTQNPLVRIDYIWLSPELRPALISCERWDTPLSRVASDHFPVLAVLDY